MHQAFVDGSPFVSGLNLFKMPILSAPIRPETIAVNDGDGIATFVISNARDPLERAKFTRLADIDAPERKGIHFITAELQSGETVQINRYLGHYCMLGLTFLLRLFNDGTCGLLHYEMPREGFQVVTDPFNREIRQYWIRWKTAPTEKQLQVLDKLASYTEGSDLRERFMSHQNPRLASEDQPFLLNINATLVLMGFAFVFTKYCCDNDLLALQTLAKQKGLGPIWCGINYNKMDGICSEVHQDYRQAVFEAGINFEIIKQNGYPTSRQTASGSREWFLPWNERATMNSQERPRRPVIPDPYGFIIDL